MRGTPPPPRRPGSGASWNRDPDRERPPYPSGNPNQTVGGAGVPYRGGPMTPGPPPGATVARGMRLGNDPNRSITPSRPAPGATYVGPLTPAGLTSRSRAVSAVASAVAPKENLLTGNLRRLWLSEIASIAGDVILSTGVVIWYLQLTYQFLPVALLIIALAAPAALVTLFAGSLAARRDPRGLLWLLGALRVALAGIFIAMHYHTVPQLVLLLAFGLSLASNMRGALRRAAVARGVPLRARGLLASGDQLAAGIMSVAGPAVATLLYVLNGERIFTIAIGGAICYAVAFLGESQAEPLPDKILYQRPAEDEPEVANVWEGDEDAGEDSRVLKAEAQAQVWELAAPPTPAAALADIGAGMRIAGSSTHAQAAFWGLTVLAGIGGALAVAQPFYVWIDLRTAPYTLGLLFTATGVGAAIASAIAVELRSGGRFFLALGLLASGIGLIVLPRMTDLPHALGTVAALGAANVFALRGGQMVLLRHFIPVGQRAVAAAIATVMALSALVGMLAGALFMNGAGSVIKPLGLENTLIIGGVGLLVMGALTGAQVLLPNKMTDAIEPPDDSQYDEDWADNEEEDADESEYDASRRYSATRGYEPRYPESDEYAAPPPPRRSRYDDDDNEPPRRPRR